MALALVNDGTNTAGLTTSSGSGFQAVNSPPSELGAVSYAAATAASVGASVGGAAAGCGVFGKLSGFSTSSTHRLILGLQTQNDLTDDHYYIQMVFTASHLRDYAEIRKVVSTVDTLLTPQSNAFADTTNKRIYFKRGKLTTSDIVGGKWIDNEIQLWHIMPDGKGFYLGKVIDSSITTAGYCGIYLGTDSSGTWDDIWTGTVPLKWVASSGSDTTGTGSKAGPYRQIRYGLHNTTAGGVTIVRTGTYGHVGNQRSYSSPTFTLTMPKGTDWYNPQVVQAYNAETATIVVTGTPVEGVGWGITQAAMQNAFHYWIDINCDGQDNHEGPGWQMISRATKIRVQGGHTLRHGTPSFAAVGFQSSYNNDAKAGHLSDYDCWIIDVEVSDHGITHGIYLIRSGEGVEFCNIHDNDYFGIQMQPTPSATVSTALNNILRNNRIWNHTVRTGAGGIYVAHTIGCQIYNNLIFSNKDGIQVNGNSLSGTYNGCDGTLIFNNVIYNNSQYGIVHGQNTGGPTNGTHAAINTQIRNNCLVGNTFGTIFWTSLGAEDNGSNGTGNVQSNNLTVDPGWVDPNNADPLLRNFALSAGSGAAYNTGFDTTATVKWDYLGFPTAGVTMEIGAYLWPESGGGGEVNPEISSPAQLEVSVGIDKVLSAITIIDPNDPDVGNYSVRLVTSVGTLNDGV